MKGSDVFQSKRLKADDLQGREVVVEIDRVTVEEVGENESKPVCYFKGKDKSLVLNKTNWNSIVDITGKDDSDDWKGHRIKLVTARVDFQGKRVNAIRIDPAGNGKPRQSEPATRADYVPPEPAETPDDSDIPF